MPPQIMVSVWAFTCPGSRSYDMLTKNNWVTTYAGADGKRTDNPITTHGKDCRLVDPTTVEARKYVWSLIETGYYQYGASRGRGRGRGRQRPRGAQSTLWE